MFVELVVPLKYTNAIKYYLKNVCFVIEKLNVLSITIYDKRSIFM